MGLRVVLLRGAEGFSGAESYLSLFWASLVAEVTEQWSRFALAPDHRLRAWRLDSAQCHSTPLAEGRPLQSSWAAMYTDGSVVPRLPCATQRLCGHEFTEVLAIHTVMVQGMGGLEPLGQGLAGKTFAIPMSKSCTNRRVMHSSASATFLYWILPTQQSARHK